MLGSKAEQDITVLENPSMRRSLSLRLHQEEAGPGSQLLQPPKAQIQGVIEETTTGVARLYKMQKSGELPSRHQRQRLGHQEQPQSLRLPGVAGGQHQARHRRDGGWQAGAGDGLWRWARAQTVLRGLGATVCIAADPICALQAAMEGYRVVRLRMWSKRWISS